MSADRDSEQTSATAPSALDGLQVIDLSRVLAGPYCTQILADHGADVLKIESQDGDETRGWGPPFLDEDQAAYFAGLNRNKRSLVLNLKSESGRQKLAGLLEGARVQRCANAPQGLKSVPALKSRRRPNTKDRNHAPRQWIIWHAREPRRGTRAAGTGRLSAGTHATQPGGRLDASPGR